MLVHRRSFPRNLLGFPNNLPVPIYTPGWREALWELSVLPKNTTQCPRPGLEPGPLSPADERTPRKSALTMRPPRLPLFYRASHIRLHAMFTFYPPAINKPSFGNCGTGGSFSAKYLFPLWKEVQLISGTVLLQRDFCPSEFYLKIWFRLAFTYSNSKCSLI